MSLVSPKRSVSFSRSFSETHRHSKYDVFLSFRGEDVRGEFLEYLHRALRQKGILTFKDDIKLEKGKRIKQGLYEAIEGSRFAIVVMSKNYADSPWCLRELVRICECERKGQLLVYPVFYHVKPSDVRNQVGAFGKGFRKSTPENKVELTMWTKALKLVGGSSGWVYPQSEFKTVAHLIDDLVDKIFCKTIDTYQIFLDELAGLRTRMLKVIELLDLGSDKTEIIGLWGMGGIGKTTLAEAVYSRISWQFEGCSFIENLTEVFNRNGVLALQEQLISDILGEDGFKVGSAMRGTSIIQNKVCQKKVLIVLDDVSEPKQLEDFIGELHSFRHGSRIIITTRNKQVLTVHRVKKIYSVKKLNTDEAVQLFSSKAFPGKGNSKKFQKLVVRAVDYANGVPLALKVLGSLLSGGTVSEWESALNTLRENPDDEVQRVLRISYDGLHWTEKEIFLDICCFMRGTNKYQAIKILDSCGFNAVAGIKVLVKKSLLTISENNELQLHDLIQKMGWSIVDEDSRKEPGNRSRLWRHNDVKDVLMEKKVTKKVEGISLLNPGNIQLRPDALARMENLRILLIKGGSCMIDLGINSRNLLLIFLICGAYCFMYLGEKSRHLLSVLLICYSMYLPDKLDYLRGICGTSLSLHLPNKLRCLVWDKYPLRCLPSTFQPDHLVELRLTNGSIEQLWHKSMLLPKLTTMDLSNSTSLTKSPDFTYFPNLEFLMFKGCNTLVDIHPSIKKLKNLRELNLKGCTSLRTLPYGFISKHLEVLSFSGCVKLDNILQRFEDLKLLWWLDLDDTGIKELPESIGNSINLISLNCSACKEFKIIPSSIGKLELLEKLLLRECSSLEKLPEEVGLLDSLKILDVAHSGIRQLPASVEQLRNLQELSFQGRHSTSWMSNSLSLRLPASFSGFVSLTTLHLMDCGLTSIPESMSLCVTLQSLNLARNDFTTLPASIKDLSKLEELFLSECKHLCKLPELPTTVTYVEAYSCHSLQTINNPALLIDAKLLWFADCPKLVGNDKINTLFGHEFLLNLIKGNKHHLRKAFSGPGSKIPMWISHRNGRCSLTFNQPIQDLNKSNLLGFVFSAVVATKHQDYTIGVQIGIKGKIFNFGDVFHCPSNSKNVFVLFYPIEFFAADDLIHMGKTIFKVCFVTAQDPSKTGFNTTNRALDPARQVMQCGAHLIYSTAGGTDVSRP